MTTDPLFSSQWHLQNNTPGLLDLNVTGVWNDYTGAGVSVFVFDDGFDYLHTDLAPNWDASRSYNYGNNNADPFGIAAQDWHGTAVMGIIGAAGNNGIGGTGIAYGATMVGYRDYDSSNFTYQSFVDTIDTVFRDAADDGADVINISQGLGNTTAHVLGIGLTGTWIADLRAAIDYAVDTGRGGLGTIIVKSAGNSRSTNYDTNASPWAADTQQIVVAAVNQNGFVSTYSSYGASNLISGFGTPGEVVTTDRRGADGYSGTDYTSTFNGTSSAAPMVSGVVALLLEANDDLGWRDVQNILAASARHVGSNIGAALSGSERFAWAWNGADNWNGGNMHYSNDYGFGLIDALAATRLAESWHIGQSARTSANESVLSDTVTFAGTGETVDGTVNGGDTTGTIGTEAYNFTIAGDQQVERVTLEMEFDTTYVGEIEVVLISPDGVEIVMLARSLPNSSADFDGRLTFEAQGFRGALAAGTWQVRLTDLYAGDEFRVQEMVLRTFGDGNTKNDRYVYTDEFSRWVNIHGHAPVLGDTDGGIDTVNTAAIGTDTVINLRNGRTSSIDGVTVTTNGNSLENAVTGDGNDEIYGNGLENVLWGMRGNDKLFGFDGRDILRGGSGRDLLNGGTGNDKLLGEQGNDRLIGDAGRDALLGGKGNDYLDGGDDADNLQGYTGNDELYGGNGRDRMDGGADNDKLVGGADRDIMDGGDGRDSLKGQAGNDVMRGGTGRDALDGGSGDDRLGGGRGNDTLKGGTGNDELTGSQGADVFVYMNGWDNDRITDFTDNQDTLHLDQALWGGGLSVAQVIAAYASVVGGDVVFDFGGGDTLRLIGWTTTAGLADDLVLI